MQHLYITQIGFAVLSPTVAAQSNNPKLSDPLLPRGIVSANNSKIDVATKLPTRIRHQASGIVLVLLPAGEFLMGLPDNELERDKDEHQHRRTIKKPFYIG